MRNKKEKPTTLQEFIAICNEQGCKFTFNFMNDNSLRLGSKPAGLTFVVDEEGYTWVEGLGERYLAEIVEKNQNRYHVVINGNSYLFSIETPFSFKRKKFLSKMKKGSKNIKVFAPMPGKIVDVISSEGEQVNAGDAIIILEAMKMQNEIRAEVSGILTKVHVKTGQNVIKEELIFEITKA